MTRTNRWLRYCVGLQLAFGVSIQSLADDLPRVSFDTGTSYACREIQDYGLTNPGRKLMEVKLGISVNLRIPEATLDSIEYKISVPRHIEIRDHLPKTELDVNQGDIIITDVTRRTTGDESTFGGSADVKYGVKTPVAKSKGTYQWMGGKQVQAPTITSQLCRRNCLHQRN